MTELNVSELVQHIAQFRAAIAPQVRIVAVTKQVDAIAVRAAYAAGLRDFGESRIQEADAKRQALADLTDVNWHLIGHLQTNKVQKAIALFDWIHSIDSLKLAERIDRVAAEQQRTPQLLLQVKLVDDPNKSGWSREQLLTDLPALSNLTHVQIRGLMAIAPLNLSSDQIFDLFKKTYEFAQEIEQQKLPNIQMDQLSMGMSNDYQEGIRAGATLIRPGRVLFCDRQF
jgi:pyridoxal phosphate enzyme (YggS family)